MEKAMVRVSRFLVASMLATATRTTAGEGPATRPRIATVSKSMLPPRFRQEAVAVPNAMCVTDRGRRDGPLDGVVWMEKLRNVVTGKMGERGGTSGVTTARASRARPCTLTGTHRTHRRAPYARMTSSSFLHTARGTWSPCRVGVAALSSSSYLGARPTGAAFRRQPVGAPGGEAFRV
jgi:hypothetical protein